MNVHMIALLIWLGLVGLVFLLWWFWPHHKSSRNPARQGTLKMSKQLNVGNTTTASVSYQDKAGATVPVVGAPSWGVDNPAVATVEPASDGMSAVVTAVGVGAANITVTAEGDPTPGVDTITLTGQVTVVDEASGGVLTFS